jgi:hypothetical protein
MYIAGVSAMSDELNSQIGDNAALESKVGEFIRQLPEGTVIPGESIQERASWIIRGANA